MPTDDSEEVTVALGRSACRRNCKPVRPSSLPVHPCFLSSHLETTPPGSDNYPKSARLPGAALTPLPAT